MKKIDPRNIEGNFIDMIGRQSMLITAGTEGDFNTMTASWGGVGELWNLPVAFLFIRPQRYTWEFAERHERFTLSFFGDGHRDALRICGTKSGRDTDKVALAGLTPVVMPDAGIAFGQAELVLECRKLYADNLRQEAFHDAGISAKVYPGGDFHRMYVVHITAAYLMNQ